MLDPASMRTGHPYVLGIPQTKVDELFAERVMRSGAHILRGHRLVGLRQDGRGVTAEVESPESAESRRQFRSRWLVGCDGGRSTVRRLSGIGFPGTSARRFSLPGDVTLADPAALPLGATSGPGRLAGRDTAARLRTSGHGGS